MRLPLLEDAPAALGGRRAAVSCARLVGRRGVLGGRAPLARRRILPVAHGDGAAAGRLRRALLGERIIPLSPLAAGRGPRRLTRRLGGGGGGRGTARAAGRPLVERIVPGVVVGAVTADRAARVPG